jgi:hypothetical protein
MPRENDPDETSGRALYRGSAEALTRSQCGMASRKVKLNDQCEYWDDDGCYCACGSMCSCVPFHPNRKR